ncbi:30S ribosomal protein S9 [Rhodonellum psychrophilum GCM71 = DSM 17998]|jgi:small subunit ribosomal protein S9|uniref:Small ribosomal subunit protein uS9 n=2 Tax=Rhodonellum TaxID=336827 RepID=U5BQE3_9BACT|nr:MULTISPECIES: 30S ribosomal protein S9 [Rhodonellum]ERM82790.1 30S ribosomal protein S9 [Rhodonellum psychrophilum GCM71 = DSM 17998]MDO9550999.1 30S ribosomal protein S9 [Rhodonellum sp.]SDY95959.1 small subunit ribosomal protein S9 [Rhodonellum ikkaensis]
MEVINTIGRRKTSVARIYMTPGNGEITVNSRTIETYFPFDLHRIVVRQPLELVKENGTYDIKINVDGGGITGQAEAARMAIARALCEINEEHRPALKKEGFLTRDPRMVERKKPGRKKARRKFQFSKR